MPATVTVEDGTIVDGANSYVSLEFANSFFETIVDPGAWTDATDDQKNRALIQATRIIDTEVRWNGQRIDPTQPLSWPRDAMVVDGILLGSTTIPEQLKEAVCYTARDLLTADPTAEPDSSGIKRLGLGQGAISIEFDAATTRLRLTTFVRRLLAVFGGSGRSGQIPVYRG